MHLAAACRMLHRVWRSTTNFSGRSPLAMARKRGGLQAAVRNASTALVPPNANEFESIVRPAAPLRAGFAT